MSFKHQFLLLRFTFGSIMGQTQDFLILKNKLNTMDEKDDALLSKVDVITDKEKILETLILELEAKQQWNLIENAVILVLIVGLGVVVCSSIISIFRKFDKEYGFLKNFVKSTFFFLAKLTYRMIFVHGLILGLCMFTSPLLLPIYMVGYTVYYSLHLLLRRLCPQRYNGQESGNGDVAGAAPAGIPLALMYLEPTSNSTISSNSDFSSTLDSETVTMFRDIPFRCCRRRWDSQRKLPRRRHSC